MVTAAAADRFLAAPLLAEADAASRRAVLEVLSEEHAPAGAVLLEQGKPNDRIAFLIEGTVSVVRSYPDGRKENVATLTAPSVFGETSFFRPTPAIVSVRANSPVWLLTLDHPAHERLRRENLKAAEQLAVAAARVLSERFDMLDKRISDYMAQHPEGHPRATEWSNFRARLFEGATI
ncbi:MAG TPA: cyclic nucleotide-binding domain-containing protein [Isosphaeraceae bacterium]|jgi:CRP-like cAMP-binding protein|nr:cyclic nucleotide-binding domain-containing protein [Isosphaeraceae bacterium]